MQMIKPVKPIIAPLIAVAASIFLIFSYRIVLGQNQSMNKPFAYPIAKKVDQVDEYHGVKVADPYRWLEDPDSPETRAWIEAQNKLTFDFLDRIPERAKIKERLIRLWNYEKYGAPFKEGLKG